MTELAPSAPRQPLFGVPAPRADPSAGGKPALGSAHQTGSGVHDPSGVRGEAPRRQAHGVSRAIAMLKGAISVADRPRPNVLWIMSDQHNAGCLGCEGRNVRTPNLDALAARGVRFSHAYCNNPICAPSRISFITGQYCHTHRHIGNNLYHYPQRNPNTLSAVARRQGYQTAMIGKAHMIGEWDREGFEYIRYCDLCDADRNDPLTCHYFKHLHDSGLVELYDQGTLPQYHPGKQTHWFVSPIPHEHSLEVWTAKQTVEFLEQRDRRRPFFVQMSFQRPHAPLSPSPERADMYSPEDIDIPSSARVCQPLIQ